MRNSPFGKGQADRFELVIKSVTRRNRLSLVFNAKDYSHIPKCFNPRTHFGVPFANERTEYK